jgi:mono/diheme cytochrome c family protein
VSVRLIATALMTMIAPLSQAADGAALYVQHCAACHDRGPAHPGTVRLADRWPNEASLLDRKQLPAAFVRVVVRQGLNLMPPFRPGELSDDELDALAAYLDAGPHPAPAGARAP